MRRVGLLVVAVGLLGSGCAGNDSAPHQDTFGPEWDQVATPPLSGRADVSLLWTGDEVWVLGGRRTEAEGPLRDAAAYDPDQDRWRTLDDLPEGLERHAEGFVVAEGLLLAFDQDDPDHLLRYDRAIDEWSTVDTPDLRGLALVGGGDRVLAVRRCTCRLHPPADLELDPATGHWNELPPSPFGTLARHDIVAVDGDDYLFSDDGEGRIEVAVRRDGGDHWDELAAGDGTLLWPLVVVDDLVVSAYQPRSFDGPTTHPPEVWAFDAANDDWVDLPELDGPVDGHSFAEAGEHVIWFGDQQLDVASRTWSERPERPETWRLGSASVWIDDGLFAYGGRTDTGFANGAYVWHPDQAS